MGGEVTADKPKFSLKRGLLHGGLAAMAVVLIGAVTAAALDVADPRGAGQAMAPAVVLGFGIALGISWLFQTGHRMVGWLSVGGVLVAVGASAVLVALTFGGPKLRTSHRVPLEVTVEGEGHKRLEHPFLRFSVDHPGEGYESASAVAEMLTKGDATSHAWGWLNRAENTMFIVAIFAGMGAGEDGDKDVHSFLDGMSKTTALTDSERDVQWSPTSKTFRQVGTVRAVRVVVTGSCGRVGRENLEACVMAMSMGGDPAATDARHATLRL